jgi:hypothetical protein
MADPRRTKNEADARLQDWREEPDSAAAATARSTASTSRTAPVSADVAIAAYARRAGETARSRPTGR